MRPTHKNHVWSYDFVADETHDGRSFRILNIIDEYTRESLASFVVRRIRSQEVIFVPADLFIEHGIRKTEFRSQVNRLRNFFHSQANTDHSPDPDPDPDPLSTVLFHLP